MSGPSFAFRISRVSIFPVQQRPEHLREYLFGCADRINGTPAHETVRTHDHGTGRRDSVCLGEMASGVGQVGAAYHVGIEDHAELVSRGERRSMPGRALGPGKQDEITAKEVERG